MMRERQGRSWVMQGAVVVSILAHASFLCASGLHRSAPKPAEEELTPPVDTWAGNTSAAALSGELSEVDVAGSDVAGTPAPAAPPSEAAPDPEPVPVKEKAPKAEEPAANAKEPAANAKEPAANAKEPAANAKEPVVKAKEPVAKAEDPDAKAEDPDAKAEDPDAKAEDPDAKASDEAPKAKKPAVKAKVPVAKASDGGEKASEPRVASGGATEKAGGAVGSSGGNFGAEGQASVRDLGRAFTRALPPACDADATWGKLGTGSAGAIEVAVIVSEEGKITGFEPISQNPPAHLVNAIKRTLALLRAGTFALQGNAVTAGRQILKLSIELSDTPAPAEEVSGAGAYGLASRWDGRRGIAEFTQTSGRHVEITVEFLRVELSKG